MTTVNYQVAASSDDAVEAWGSSPSLTDTSIHLSGAGDYWGLRFLAVAVPQGATIDAATLSVFNLDSSDVTMESDVFAEDVDDATTFTTTDGNIDGRTKTTASVAWSTTLTFADWSNAPDIAAVIQEIVNRVGWVSGNDLVILVESNAGADARIRTYDNLASRGAKLSVDYTVAGFVPGRVIIDRCRPHVKM